MIKNDPDVRGQASENPEKMNFFSRLISSLGRFTGRMLFILAGVLALLLLLYLFFSSDGFISNNKLKKEKEKIETEIEALEDANRILEQKLERLQNDPAYVEDEARKKLRLVRPGETIYRLADEPDINERKEPKEPPELP